MGESQMHLPPKSPPEVPNAANESTRLREFKRGFTWGARVALYIMGPLTLLGLGAEFTQLLLMPDTRVAWLALLAEVGKAIGGLTVCGLLGGLIGGTITTMNALRTPKTQASTADRQIPEDAC